MIVEDGKKVSIEYTLSVEGEVVDSNKGGSPLEYVHGQKAIIPGLEKALSGLKTGDSKSVTVQPEEGYGPVDERALQQVNMDQIPEEAQKVGAHVVATDGEGNTLQSTVTEIKDDTITLDFNHPLAGKTLDFEVKIVAIQ